VRPPAAPAASLRVAIDLPRLIERMHRRFLDIVRAELTRLGADDLNAVQAMQLLNIDDEMNVQELIDRGHYIGANALYNVKKLGQTGYLEQFRAPNDRRALRLRLTAKGVDVCARLRARLEAVPSDLSGGAERVTELEVIYRRLRDLERAWDDYLRYGRA
jgi:DNA-binding MarR family transcriptional regulator